MPNDTLAVCLRSQNYRANRKALLDLMESKGLKVPKLFRAKYMVSKNYPKRTEWNFLGTDYLLIVLPTKNIRPFAMAELLSSPEPTSITPDKTVVTTDTDTATVKVTVTPTEYKYPLTVNSESGLQFDVIYNPDNTVTINFKNIEDGSHNVDIWVTATPSVKTQVTVTRTQ